MDPLVSIVTPCYNHSEYLAECLESVLAQTYSRLELVFVDDRSSDDSWQVFLAYENRLRSRLEGLVAWRHETNVGLLATMEELVGAASGDLLCVLESDDVFYPEKVRRNVAYLASNSQYGAVHGEVDFLFADGTIERNHWRQLGRQVPQGDIFEDLLRENHILSCTFCCRVELLRQHVDFAAYAERGYLTADYACFLDLARHTRIGYIDEALAVYRVVEGSISHPRQHLDELRWRRRYLAIKRDFIDRYGASQDVVARAERQHWDTEFRQAYWSGDRDRSRRAFAWLLSNHPQRYSTVMMRLRNASVGIPLFSALVRRFDRWASTIGG
jgi:alpha-1,3-rhamnosyltransferase